MSSDQTTPDPDHAADPDTSEEQSEPDRELQEENAETSLDQPSS